MTSNDFELYYFQQIFKVQQMFLEKGNIQDSFQDVLDLAKEASDSNFVGSILLDTKNGEVLRYFFSEFSEQKFPLKAIINKIVRKSNLNNGGVELIFDKLKFDTKNEILEWTYALSSIGIKQGVCLVLVMMGPKLTRQDQLKKYLNNTVNCLRIILRSAGDYQFKKLSSEISDKKYSFVNFLEEATDIICVFDKEFEPIYSSSSFREILGFCPDRNNKELFLDKFLNGRKERITLFSNQDNRGQFEIETKSGKKLWFDTVFSPIKNENGDVEALLAVSRDISKEEKLKSTQKFALQKEKELNSSKSQFISITSHEFKTPLSTIKSSVEICKIELERNTDKFPSREKFNKHFKRINGEADRMNTLLNNLLNLEKINQGVIQVKLKKKYLNNYLNTVLENYLDQDLIFLDIDLQEDFKISLDEDLVRQSLFNLVENALKYGSRDLKPVVKTYLLDDELNLCVQDFGEGISDEDKKNLFKPFYRASNSHKYEKGSGLGLMITQKFIELVGGKVSFKSELGKGSTFTIHLPLSIEK
ncbi:PAS domain-containing sensor histidine kinase [Echinicola shivajiensis]|uniref:PAS domain-containing sensor histidine kinase n=1 Tax=Echinicola shivajiensis TaxID=1035916 RepID=UPI001BFC7941|nr:PAS domain-containing sensor histidine kinase [Echinicola shivajiensis]